MRDRATRLHAQFRDYGTEVEFFVLQEGDEKRALAKPVVFEDDARTDGVAGSPDPTFKLARDRAQEFFEALWLMGFRSKHDRGSIDTLDAARLAHIEDLRRAAFEEPLNVQVHGS